MGVVIDFPVREAASVPGGESLMIQRAQVVILPVIRIERYEDQPTFMPPTRPGEASRKRRRRSSGS